ncbi:MAG: hypothetical protein DRQ47_08530, partial [Gammaproteobacteria bacterium]
LFVGAIALIGPFIGKGALGPIVNSGSLSFTVALLLTTLSAVRLRKTAPELSRPYRSHIVTLYLGVLMSGILVSMMIIPASPGHLKPLEFIIIGCWMLLGIVGYSLRIAKDDMGKDERSRQILGAYR